MRRNDKGQAIVIIAFAIVGLAALVGLAIDGGRLYSQRRQTQNAADAAAMAGTRKLADVLSTCGPGNSAADAAVRDAVIEIAGYNGVSYGSPVADLLAAYVNADGADRGWVGTGTIPSGSTGVRVRTALTDTTTFLKLVGQRHLYTVGDATAMVGEIRTLGPGMGMLPIAVPEDIADALSSGDNFYLMENNNHEGGTFCLDENADSCIGDPSEANAHRGWLNLNYIYNTEHLSAGDALNRSFESNVPNRGCGSDPSKSVDDGLQGWAGDGCPYPFPIFAGTHGRTDGDFIHGDPGARQSSLRDVITAYNGQTAIVPIFDFIYMSDYMDEHFTAPEEPPDGSLSGDNWPRAGGGGHAFLYHIVGFAVVQIHDDVLNDHILEANFDHAVWGGSSSDIVPTAGIGNYCELSPLSLALWE